MKKAAYLFVRTVLSHGKSVNSVVGMPDTDPLLSYLEDITGSEIYVMNIIGLYTCSMIAKDATYSQ